MSMVTSLVERRGRHHIAAAVTTPAFGDAYLLVITVRHVEAALAQTNRQRIGTRQDRRCVDPLRGENAILICRELIAFALNAAVKPSVADESAHAGAASDVPRTAVRSHVDRRTAALL